MAKIGIYYGSTTGNTQDLADRIAKALGVASADVHDVSSAAADFNPYDVVLLGSSTMGMGDLQDDWETFIDDVKDADLNGKKVALFGCGDSSSYSDTFGDALGKRGIPNAVINEHLVGDLVKFYGVADTDFFFHFYPFDISHSKFGLEEINGAANMYPFSTATLKEACDKAGEVLNVKIYGGDCVVAKDGSFKIIDFNDWPSFAPCREQAAPKIAECIHKQVQKKLK